MKLKLKKGDQVKITLGKDRGKKGKIEKVFQSKRQILISGINVYKKHVKPRGEGKPGGIVDISKPLAISKVALICPKCDKPTRVGFKFEGEAKKRICKKCQSPI